MNVPYLKENPFTLLNPTSLMRHPPYLTENSCNQETYLIRPSPLAADKTTSIYLSSKSPEQMIKNHSLRRYMKLRMKEAKWAQTHKPKMKKCPWQWSRKKNLVKYPWDPNITDKIAHLSISHLLLQIAPLNLKKKKLTLRKTLNQLMKSHSVRRYMKLQNQKKHSMSKLLSLRWRNFSANKAEKTWWKSL